MQPRNAAEGAARGAAGREIGTRGKTLPAALGRGRRWRGSGYRGQHGHGSGAEQHTDSGHDGPARGRQNTPTGLCQQGLMLHPQDPRGRRPSPSAPRREGRPPATHSRATTSSARVLRERWRAIALVSALSEAMVIDAGGGAADKDLRPLAPRVACAQPHSPELNSYLPIIDVN